MWLKHSMSIAQQLMPIYNTTVPKNRNAVALNVATSVPKLKTPTCQRAGLCHAGNRMSYLSSDLCRNASVLQNDDTPDS